METIPILPSRPSPSGKTPAGPPPRGFALFALGFRPFYLGGAIFAALAIAAWSAMLAGMQSVGPAAVLPGMFWHAHEMVFGFAAAIVVGFLFTAGRAWTGQPTPTGAALAVLFLLWLAGRVGMWLAPGTVAFAIEGVFLPLAALAFTRTLARAGNRRNYPLALALWLLAVADIAALWLQAGGHDVSALRACRAGVALVTLFVVVIGGRVIPMFTTNAIPGFRLRQYKQVDRMVIPATVLGLASGLLPLPGWLAAALSLLAAGVLAVRVAGWRGYAVGNRPLLWVLHLAYAWLPLALLLQALGALRLVMAGLATHAFTVGVLGMAIIAMITRTALGHTGRMLVAGRTETVAYWLIAMAAVLRVFGPMAWPAGYLHWIWGAGACWVAGFGLYAMTYAPRLARPRVDGKPG
ncbi:NnrS family protein [Cupriavidus consociatus]|uniref:NnrS family protein n=1 Tax=Cupriavidus consociatus TaxID=2821357 RepID=UPI001AE47826|nr:MULTISPECIES: NnrS family protein [unclassified Cupriavidus]MBP0619775.1 NnrS family protein [Cupriavidus sp. LEh25]MDK2656427.1 NnrS family protein [Cupriavidus sp. LEh21]